MYPAGSGRLPHWKWRGPALSSMPAAASPRRKSGPHHAPRSRRPYTAANDLRDAVAREIGFYEYGDSDYCPKDKRTINYMKRVCSILGKLGKVMHSLDYYLSGDIGEDKFIADYEKFMTDAVGHS